MKVSIQSSLSKHLLPLEKLLHGKAPGADSGTSLKAVTQRQGTNTSGCDSTGDQQPAAASGNNQQASLGECPQMQVSIMLVTSCPNQSISAYQCPTGPDATQKDSTEGGLASGKKLSNKKLEKKMQVRKSSNCRVQWGKSFPSCVHF